MFESLDEKVRGKHCDGIAGIIEEGKSIMEEDFDETTMDACLIAAGQRAEHYEMAAYGTLVAWAQAMGHTEAAKLLQQTLDEEKAADKKLSGLAEGGINQSAADAAHPEETRNRWRRQQCQEGFGEGRSPVARRAVEGAMVLIQLLLPTSGAAGADGLAPLAETRRELADRFNGLTAYLRSPAKGWWTARWPYGTGRRRHGGSRDGDVRPGMVAHLCGHAGRRFDQSAFTSEPCLWTCSTRDIMNKPFAIVTGASSGIGLELAAICAQEGFDLLVAADRPEIQTAADRFRGLGAEVTVVETDLATTDGVDRLWAAAAGRPVDALLANAGHGLGRAFLDQDFEDVRHVIDTNVTGTVYLVQLVGRAHAQPGPGTHPADRFDRRLHARHLSSGLQRHQGVRRFVLVCAARRAEGYRRDRHVPDAGRHRDRLLRTGRHAGHESRPGKEGRPGGCGARRASTP